jgi:hypothetical protein
MLRELCDKHPGEWRKYGHTNTPHPPAANPIRHPEDERLERLPGTFSFRAKFKKK